jgi:diguanylate cyclase (GGDEF)-like protein
MLKTANDGPLVDNISIRDVINQQWVTPHYQCIMDYSNTTIFGFESLTRSNYPTNSISADRLFKKAEEQELLKELDQFCMHLSIQKLREQHFSGYLFINILPITLSDIVSQYATVKTDKPLKNIVFEISEKLPLDNFDGLKEQVNALRFLGAKIAIDDFGAGYSGLKTWAEIRPDFVKVDRHFVDNIHKDVVKREFVRSITDIALGLRCTVIAEGIENIQEMEVLHSLGIKLGQGYFFHRPEANPKNFTPNPMVKSERSTAFRQINIRPNETIDNILEKVSPLWPSIRSDCVNDLFKKNPNISSIPIVENQLPIGMISRARMLEIFSNRYSYQLHGNKPIADFMEVSPIVVDHQMGIQDVSKKITAHGKKDLNTDFIITANNHYVGVGKVTALLEQITDTQIRYARYSNPLTLLPGNVPIDEWIDDLLRQKEEFWLAYFDINHFKPFNDYFGYSQGDEVIKCLADIIIENVAVNRDMVGHIGGDDFIVIFRSHDWEKHCQQILMDFEQTIKRFYAKKDLEEQGIWCKNRQGENTFFKLLSLAIGVIAPDSRSLHSHHEISALAADAKHQAKQAGGNHLFICRRRNNKLSRFQDHSEKA